MYKIYMRNKIRVGERRERTIAWLDRLCWLSRDQHALFATLSWSYLAPGTSPKVQQWQWDWWCRSFVFGFTFSFTSSSNTLIQFKRSSQSAGTTAERISIHITRVPSNLVAKRVILSPMTWMEKIWRLLNVFEEALRYFIISSWRHALVHSKSFKKSSWLCGVSCWLKGSCYHKQSLLKHPFGFFSYPEHSINRRSTLSLTLVPSPSNNFDPMPGWYIPTCLHDCDAFSHLCQ